MKIFVLTLIVAGLISTSIRIAYSQRKLDSNLSKLESTVSTNKYKLNIEPGPPSVFRLYIKHAEAYDRYDFIETTNGTHINIVGYVSKVMNSSTFGDSFVEVDLTNGSKAYLILLDKVKQN